MAYFTTNVIARITNEQAHLEDCISPSKINTRDGLVEAITAFNMLIMVTTSLSTRLNSFYVTSLTNTNKLCLLNGELKACLERAKAIIRAQLCARYALVDSKEYFLFIERGFKALKIKGLAPFDMTAFNKAVNKVLDRESEYWGFRITPTLLQHQILSQSKNYSGVVREELFGQQKSALKLASDLILKGDELVVVPRRGVINTDEGNTSLESDIKDACDSEGDIAFSQE
ncbi:P26 [Blackcurrant leafroll-associated virus 1]|uniref:P26 n=1 Tax=Blackcurrant leafroll-associated virus 1 TaxID=2292426 RepID=UPI000E3349E6|nr:P26 [Blackcurrant leafroll-associated virus 1]AXN56995.1 P26 [Blackcurrant leafroll-associated virus 1]